MPTPAVTLRLKRFRRRFGITAPKVVVRSHWPWRWLVPVALLAVVLLVAIVWLLLQRNEVGGMGLELRELQEQFRAQQEELMMLRSTAGTGRSSAEIERSAQQELLARIQGLERENVALKEDMLLFERLIPVTGDEAVLRIENFRVVPEGERRYRYRLLIAFQPGKQTAEFRGRLQLTIVGVRAGKPYQQLLPDSRESAAEYQLDVRHFLRREGVLTLPPEVIVKNVEVRILQGDAVKAKRTVQL